MIPGLNTEPENIHTQSIPEKHDSIMNTPDTSESSSESSDSDSDYLSFDDSDDDEDAVQAKAAREREKQRVLEAAGLIVNQNVGPAPLRPKAKSIKRRPAPAAPRRMPSILTKDLPPVPRHRARSGSRRTGAGAGAGAHLARGTARRRVRAVRVVQEHACGDGAEPPLDRVDGLRGGGVADDDGVVDVARAVDEPEQPARGGRRRRGALFWLLALPHGREGRGPR